MYCNFQTLTTQNSLLMKNLTDFYHKKEHLDKMFEIVNGQSNISLRIVDWFVTNYSKQNYVVYNVFRPTGKNGELEPHRFKVYNDYKLRLKSYAKLRFDPFCRWERITIPYEDNLIETTIGQLNFFKWAIENDILLYIQEHYHEIEMDMNLRNSTSKKKTLTENSSADTSIVENKKTRKKREELSISACKCIKKETVNVVIKF